MTAPNNNYVETLTGFSAQNFYQAANGGAFNAAAAGQSFGAFVLFLINGGYQQANTLGPAQPSFLWGNEDVANITGWSLRIQAGGAPLPGTADDPILTANINDGTTRFTALLPFTLGGGVAGGALPGPGYAERLILAMLMWDAESNTMALGVNGSIPHAVPTTADYAPSSLPTRMGFSPEDDEPATFVEICAAGYIRFLPGGVGDWGDFGGFAGSAFRAAREVNRGSFLTAPGSFDWVHRYQAVTPNAGTIARVANIAGALQTGAPAAPATLADLGGLGISNAAAGLGPSPVALNLNGALSLDQRRNPDWFHGGAWAFFSGG